MTTKIERERLLREKVRDCAELLALERLVHVGNMWFVRPWYDGSGVIFLEKGEEQIVVSVTSETTCGRLINAGKYKQLENMIEPIAIEEFERRYDGLFQETFKILESRFEELDSTMKVVVLLREL